MADTLEEFVNATFDEDDFNSNGQATLLTSNANTRYVIKDIQVDQADDAVKVLPTLDINGFDVITLGENGATGHEIIGTSSTLRATSSAFPLQYQDVVFGGVDSSTLYDKAVRPLVNGIEDTSQGTLTSNNNTIISGTFAADAQHMYATNVGVNNVIILIQSDANSQTNFYAFNSSGTQIQSDTSSYRPKAFDGERYVYWASGSNIKQWDSHTDTLTNIPNTLGSMSHSSYSVACYCGEGWFYFNGSYTSGTIGTRPFIFNAYTKEFVDCATNNDSAQGKFGHAGGGLWGVFNGDDTIYMFRNSNTTDHVKYEVNVKTGSVSSGTNIALPSGYVLSEARNWKSVYDRKLWFVDHASNVRYYDAVKNDNQWTDAGFNVNANYSGSQKQIVVYKSNTPSADVSSRTYGINPGVKLRITGIKSET
jgi:hypothetical protein